MYLPEIEWDGNVFKKIFSIQFWLAMIEGLGETQISKSIRETPNLNFSQNLKLHKRNNVHFFVLHLAFVADK